MRTVKVNGIELPYETKGSGEPVLLIGPGPIPDGFLPFFSEPRLTERYCLIRYHQRGQDDVSSGASPVSFAEHAADAAALLAHLGVDRAHIAGHSTGGAIGLQLALDHPELVHALVLLEPAILAAPSAAAFFEAAGPAVAAYEAGDHATAMAAFLSVVSGLDRDTCRSTIEAHIPGGMDRAVKSSAVFFGSYLPALQAWQFGATQAASITQPVLSVLGSDSERLFVESAALLRQWLPDVEDCLVDGVGHLLHLQRPQRVGERIAAFLARHVVTTNVRTPGAPVVTAA